MATQPEMPFRLDLNSASSNSIGKPRAGSIYNARSNYCFPPNAMQVRLRALSRFSDRL